MSIIGEANGDGANGTVPSFLEKVLWLFSHWFWYFYLYIHNWQPDNKSGNLLHCAKDGNVQKIVQLLDEGVDVNSVTVVCYFYTLLRKTVFSQ